MKSETILKKEIKKILEILDKDFKSKFVDTSFYKKHGLDYLDAMLSLYIRSDEMKNIKEWEVFEKNRQKNKTLSTKMGHLQEQIPALFDGWERVAHLSEEKKVKYKGVDVINRKKKIAFEIKNKHNTLNSGGSKSVAKNLSQFSKTHKGWKMYLVLMLPKPNSDLSQKGIEKKEIKVQGGEKIPITIITGKKMYEMITGDKAFYKKLITEILPSTLNLKNSDKSKVKRFYEDIYDCSKPLKKKKSIV